MPEWSNGLVLKTSVAKVTEGSNPSLSARRKCHPQGWLFSWAEREGVALRMQSVTRFEKVASDFGKIVTTCTVHVMKEIPSLGFFITLRRNSKNF